MNVNPHRRVAGLRRLMITLALVLAAFWAAPLPALAQGFAGLGTTSDGYLHPDPATRFAFPADHGPHPGFRIEWWYLTANLNAADGTPYGLQWTLFRSALAPDPQTPPIWMGHAAVTTPTQHFAAERFARGGTGQAGVTDAPFAAWIDDWQMTGPSTGSVTARGVSGGAHFAYDMRLSTDAPFVPQGTDGYSVKSAKGHASHYFSQPFYQISGVLTLDGAEVAVSGQAWLDREWSAQPLDPDQSGWDWISLHLDGGAKLMGFQLRSKTQAAYTTGTWIDAQGRAQPIAAGAIQFTALDHSEVGDKSVPTAWRVTYPARDLDVTIRALNPNAWMPLTVPYWEGPVLVSGSHAGQGYLEMTGYD